MQLAFHITNNHNFLSYQSAYRFNHSTKTAFFHVLDDVYADSDKKKAFILRSLDLTATFDTINCRIFLSVLGV